MDNHLDDVDDGHSYEDLHLRVTAEQRETIMQLFVHNDWDYRQLDCQNSANYSSQDPDAVSDDEISPGFIIPQQALESECASCLCRPCITHVYHRQMWWEDTARTPSIFNSRLRKAAFKRFWTMLFHRDVWRDPRYKERKLAALQNDPRRRRYCWYHKRDILPDCVLKLVRGWYPNPTGIPYMGHFWE